jgi:hypothetical protein
MALNSSANEPADRVGGAALFARGELIDQPALVGVDAHDEQVFSSCHGSAPGECVYTLYALSHADGCLSRDRIIGCFHPSVLVFD